MNVERTIIKIAGQCFRADPATLSMASSPHDVDGWDSLSLFSLISMIEQAFNLTFSPADIGNIRSLGDACQAVVRQLGISNVGPADERQVRAGSRNG